jgi:hypothetical protein
MKNVMIKINLMEMVAPPIALLSQDGAAQITIILDNLPSAQF